VCSVTKFVVMWDVTPCILVDINDALEEPVASGIGIFTYPDGGGNRFG
jgi:hypothetical protein